MAVANVTMSNTAVMPQIGFGLYLIPREETRAAVRTALESGYRHFDSASFYDNEAEAGAELQAWIAEGNKRSELFVTTKVWTTDLKDAASARRSAELSIQELGLGYVDLLMVHWPVPGTHVECYKALEGLVPEKAKALGISNYSPQDYEELVGKVSIPPVVNTFEVNPLLFRKEWIDFFLSKGVTLQAYKPLQRGGASLTTDEVGAIAERFGKSAGQVCIRWLVQKGIVVLVKSTKTERQKENISVFDFVLNEEDVSKLDGLTTPEAIATALGHYEKRRSGTPAPWGEGLRPEVRVLS